MPRAGHEPFVEEVVAYCPRLYDFTSHIVRLLQVRVQLADLHLESRPRLQSPLIQDVSFTAMYHDFLRDVVRQNLGEEMLIFEHCPNLRIHLAGEKSLTSPHTDKDHQHSEAEINFWVPLTRCFGDASLYAESAPGKGDFHAFDVEPGRAVRFYGNQCLHFTRDNRTTRSRVSFDFRVIRMRDFCWSQVPPPGDERTSQVRWSLFGYYDVMAADGSILTPDEWQSRVEPFLAHQAQQTASRAPTGYSLPSEGPSLQRERSQSPDHLASCARRHGSAREARRQCARCGWIANRERLLQLLCFSDGSGRRRPWVAENPDLSQPWGLGCQLCASKASSSASSAFTEYSFGVSMPGLLFQPLLRHGNHAMRQGAAKGQLVVQQDMEHAAAQKAVLDGILKIA